MYSTAVFIAGLHLFRRERSGRCSCSLDPCVLRPGPASPSRPRLGLIRTSGILKSCLWSSGACSFPAYNNCPVNKRPSAPSSRFVDAFQCPILAPREKPMQSFVEPVPRNLWRKTSSFCKETLVKYSVCAATILTTTVVLTSEIQHGNCLNCPVMY